MPGYQTRQDTVAVHGAADLVIRSLLDREQFSDPDGVAQRQGISSAAWPLFGLRWPSGLQLAVLMAARAVRPGERILEIGCGLALASLVAHRRGADVTASDCHPLAGSFLAENLRLNGLAPMKYRHGPWSGRSEPLEPSAEAAGASLPDGAGATGIVRGRFGLIVGSDVLYERDAQGHLAGFIDHHALAAAEVWIVDPDRGNRSAFNRRMAGYGFGADERRLDREASADGPAYKGRWMCYRRS